jgi:uncharacterized protein (DUF697 family)
MTTQVKNADQIIKDHVWFSMVPGFLPIPVLDIAAITGIQLDMVKQLCRHYEIDYNAQRGKSITMALFSTIAGRMPAYALRTAFKTIPLVGWAIGGATMATFAGASTYATGAVFKEHFEEGGTLNNLDPESFRKFYRQQMEKGKELIDELFDSKKPEDS